MPDFQPFRGIHYRVEREGADISDVAAPPYDVIDDDRRHELAERHTHNAVHLTLPTDERPGDRYDRAAALFRQWLDDGILVTDPEPAFYVYRVGFDDEDGVPRQMTGVIGALDVVEPGTGDVLPHERTMPKPASDRLDLIRTTRANLEPIWGLSLASGLSDLLDPDDPPLVTCTDTRGAHHRLYRLDAVARVEKIAATVASAPVVIADGHHRYETSLRYREERLAAGDGPGGHDHIMALLVELADEQLAVQPIHRVIRSLPDGGTERLREMLADRFEIVDAGTNDNEGVANVSTGMHDAETPALVTADRLFLLIPRPGALDAGLEREPEPVRGVDAARFEAGIAPLLDDLGAEITYRHDRFTVCDSVRDGAADAAVLLRPVDVPVIREVAHRGERMPQKTTFFHPKPSTGLVFRSLEARATILRAVPRSVRSFDDARLQ